MPLPRIKKKHIIVTLIILVQTAFGIFGGVVAASTSGNEKIFPGVFISGTDVGGLTPAEAEARLRQKMEPATEGNLVVKYQNKQWSAALSDLELNFKYRDSAWSAYMLGREKNPLTRVVSSFKLRRRQADIDLAVAYNAAQVDRFLSLIAGEINQPGRDARASIQNGRIEITPEQSGIELELPAARMLIIESIKKLGSRPVDLPVKQKKPRVTARELASIKEEISTFTTVFNPGNENRAHNIRLAAQFLNNSVVKPGEKFSFNNQVGPRILKYGYKEAPVIANKKLQPGIGGGVCQVSTTLYQALLYAGFTAKDRTPHSKPPAYVPLGQDAAVADNQIDFTFVNTNSTPLLIITEVNYNKITVRIFGKKEQNYIIKLSSENIRRIEPEEVIIPDLSLPKGKKIVTRGEAGYRVKVYRSILENGRIIKKELLSDDYYRPTDTLVRVGIR